MSPVVAAARRWLGTPYLHQASVRGAGTDCLGLIRGIWREVEGQEPVAVPPYTPDWSEPQGSEALFEAGCDLMRAVPAGAPKADGQILLFRMRDGSVAKHLGVFADDGPYPTFIHAYSGRGVIESPLSRPWLRRVSFRFVFPSQPFFQE